MQTYGGLIALLLSPQRQNAGFQRLKLQRLGLQGWPGVQRLDTTQHFTHCRCLGRVNKTMLQVPLRGCR